MASSTDAEIEAEAAGDAPPIRSLLFVPGNREDRIRRALASEADALAIDLESATPAGELEQARAIARRVIGERERTARPRLFVRVAQRGSADQARDLAAVVHPALCGVLLPQVVGPEDVAATDAALARAESAAGVPPGRTRIMPLVESASAIRLAYEIARASPRVAYMGGATSGDGDLARSLGYRFSAEGQETLFLRSKVLVDVRAAGVPNPLSGLWGRVDDLDGLAALARQSRDLGYEGFMTIHPKQLAIVNAIFSPSPEEIAQWRALVAAMESASLAGLGAIRHGGRLVDGAHVKTARQRLERARRLGLA